MTALGVVGRAWLGELTAGHLAYPGEWGRLIARALADGRLG